jgi:histidinol dehydrogenase
MQIIQHPEKKDWKKILARPLSDLSILEPVVSNILHDVKENGDAAVKKYELQFDKAELQNLQIEEQEIARAAESLSPQLIEAIMQAKANIEKFHSAQLVSQNAIETMPGVRCWRKNIPIEKVGLYIPGGTAPLFSTILMLAIPARIAGCEDIILCSPPDAAGNLHPAILFAAQLTGVTKIFRVGGVQAIAAMTYGTASIPKVYKIFGPGNRYVTLAKQLVQRDGIAIDMPAGPSEVAVYADETADPAFIAADLLSQAEHGVDSQVLLVTVSSGIAVAVQKNIQQQIENLSRKNIAKRSLENSRIILVKNSDEAMELLNDYAPEHLILACDEAETLSAKVRNAGSVFIGHYSPESVGDYASGTNHTLPTNGFAKAYSGVSVDSFVKKISFQQLSRQGLETIRPVVETMAEAEGLDAHARAVSIRLQKK